MKKFIPSTPKLTSKLTHKKKCIFSNAKKKFKMYTSYIKIQGIVFSEQLKVFGLAHTKKNGGHLKIVS